VDGEGRTIRRMPTQRQDYFISYNRQDEVWATWIAWQLEQAGYTTVIQAWDFRPGSNFVLEMQAATESADKTIAVLSPAFLGSSFTPAEWANAFAGDPGGERRALIPVRVAPCEADGLLRHVVYIDLVGVDEHEASGRLLSGLELGRAKPLTPPEFPGEASSSSGSTSPGARQSLRWQPLTETLDVKWRNTVQRLSDYGPSVIEVHLIPVVAQRMEVRRLATLANELAVSGRSAGLFTQAQSVETSSSSDTAVAQVGVGSTSGGTGLLVSRQGQRGGWFTLPHDHMGSVFDSSDLVPRISALLELLTSLDLTDPGQSRSALQSIR
jgi:hypothetical protein